jgi:hypothetical protein
MFYVKTAEGFMPVIPHIQQTTLVPDPVVDVISLKDSSYFNKTDSVAGQTTYREESQKEK